MQDPNYGDRAKVETRLFNCPRSLFNLPDSVARKGRRTPAADSPAPAGANSLAGSASLLPSRRGLGGIASNRLSLLHTWIMTFAFKLIRILFSRLVMSCGAGGQEGGERVAQRTKLSIDQDLACIYAGIIFTTGPRCHYFLLALGKP
jgi:hypothetical protein